MLTDYANYGYDELCEIKLTCAKIHVWWCSI